MKRVGIFLLMLLGLGACIAISVVAAPFVDFLIVISSAPQMAYALVPPEYPSAQLVKSYQRTGTESRGDWRTYRTEDSVGQVLMFMEEHMPGFIEEHDPTRGTLYRNHREDKSDRAQRAVEYACFSLFCTTFDAKSYPSVYITLYADPQNASATFIEKQVD
jgi:hypothetical protein